MPKPELVLSGGRVSVQRQPSTTGLPARRPQATKVAREQILRGLRLPTSGPVLATLSPASPGVANRAALVFVNPSGVDCGASCAWWRADEVPESHEDKRVVVWFRSEPGIKRYLLDAVVNAGLPQAWSVKTNQKTYPFDVQGPGVQETIQIPDGGGHAAFVAPTPTSGWYGYSLSAPVPWRFTFWYCEITRI